MTGPSEQLRRNWIEAQQRSARLEAEMHLLRQERGADAADDEHDPDGATLSGEWSRLEGLRVATAAELDDLVAAIARAEAGTYGVCIGCGRNIPAARLEARPAALRCVNCAAK